MVLNSDVATTLEVCDGSPDVSAWWKGATNGMDDMVLTRWGGRSNEGRVVHGVLRCCDIPVWQWLRRGRGARRSACMSLPVRTRRTVSDSHAGHDAGNVDCADDENEGVHLVSSFHGLGGLVSSDSLGI